MAQRPTSRSSIAIAEFDRVFDELFEDLLISRWRRSARTTTIDGAVVVESDTQYHVRIDAAGVDADRIEVEAGERRLIVKMAGTIGAKQSAFDFSHSVDADSVTARLKDGVLEITLPKKRGRKIAIR